MYLAILACWAFLDPEKELGFIYIYKIIGMLMSEASVIQVFSLLSARSKCLIFIPMLHNRLNKSYRIFNFHLMMHAEFYYLS